MKGLRRVKRRSTDKEVPVQYTGIPNFVPGFVFTHSIGVRVAFAIPTWTNSAAFSYADCPIGKGRKRSTQAALLSTRPRRNWHPSGETRKSLTGSGKFWPLDLKATMTRDTESMPPADRLLRLPEVLTKVPVGRASWWKGVKDGRYPAAIKLGPRTSAWRASDIDKLIASL
ncbi:helix-turn-helix transcriptional regulator [Variovorax sp. tm]|uniref:helix-turn-helix transcriptional regulator n=1 Tax=Variovorax atrisoli TaxID=3394203 RepID=UPI003A7F691E